MNNGGACQMSLACRRWRVSFVWCRGVGCVLRRGWHFSLNSNKGVGHWESHGSKQESVWDEDMIRGPPCKVDWEFDCVDRVRGHWSTASNSRTRDWNLHWHFGWRWPFWTRSTSKRRSSPEHHWWNVLRASSGWHLTAKAKCETRKLSARQVDGGFFAGAVWIRSLCLERALARSQGGPGGLVAAGWVAVLLPPSLGSHALRAAAVLSACAASGVPCLCFRQPSGVGVHPIFVDTLGSLCVGRVCRTSRTSLDSAAATVDREAGGRVPLRARSRFRLATLGRVGDRRLEVVADSRP